MISRTQSYPTRPTGSRPGTGRPTATGWAWGLLALPVLVFGWVWNQYALNIPKWDDHALRAFLYYFEQEETLSGKLYQVFKQHNEHRIVYDRLVTLLDYTLFGKLNYMHLMVVGNASLLGLLAVFVAVLRRQRVSLLYALPVSLLLFNLSQWENMFWGMAALQNFSVVLWVIAAFYFLTYTRRWGLALAAGVLATLTSGNGLLVWPIGSVLLLLRIAEPRSGAGYRNQPRRVFGPLLGWAAGATVVVGLYFTGFQQPGDISYVRPGAFDLLKGWFAVIGAAAEALPVGSPLRNSVALGGLLTLATFGILAWGVLSQGLALSRISQRLVRPGQTTSRAALPPLLLFFAASVGFVLGTAAVVAWARTGFGADLLITSRYKIYSLMLLVLLYVYAVATLPASVGRWAGLAGGLGAAGLTWLSYTMFIDDTVWWRHWLTTNQFNWTYTTNQPVAQLDPITQRYTDPAPAFYDALLPTIFGPARSSVTPVAVSKTPAGYAMRNNTTPALGLLDAGAYLLARSAKRNYLFPVWQHTASPLRAALLLTHPLTTGFNATVGSIELDAGTYELFVLTVTADGRANLHPTRQTLISAGQRTDSPKKNW